MSLDPKTIPSDHPISADRAHKVTIGLVNGQKLTGVLAKFSPLLPHLSLETKGKETAVTPKSFPVEEVAYVAFHREENLPIRSPQRAGMRRVKVHLIEGESFVVEVMLMNTSTESVGFYGHCIDPQSPYHTIFFYRQSVRSTESVERIGTLLVNEGAIDSKELQRGIATQAAERRLRIGEILVEQQKVERKEVEQAAKVQQRKRMRLGEVLVEAGLITQQDIEKALAEQRKRRGKKLGEILVAMGLVSEGDIGAALAMKFHLPFINLDEYRINPAACTEISEELIVKHQFLPIDTDAKTLTVAIADPCAIEVYDVLRFQVKKKINEVLVTPTQLHKHIERWLGKPQVGEVDVMPEDLVVELGQKTEEPEEKLNADLLKKEADETPVIRLVNQLILRGLQKGASDIHLLPQNKGLVLAYRINGDLLEDTVLDKRIQRQVISRIKVLGGMDISERRLPQDGRILLRRDEQRVEFRVSCIPNTFGESIVMRVLNKDMAVDLNKLGLREVDRQRLLLLSQRPFGLLLVTGPTGSGKSTTLFALLKEMIARPLHIVTIEDPVESEIPEVNQIQANAKIGMTFARILRNILRHDPDVIMVGEMRDTETASIGIESALTGHLMLSTLHTNTAVDTIIRLTDMGIPAYLVAPALLGVISQNLVKRLCPDCRKPVPLHDEVFKIMEDVGLSTTATLYKAGGCSKCHNTGYVGRVMLYEFLEVNDVVRAGIHKGLTGSPLQEIAVAQGMIPKTHHALELANQGIIGRDDLIRALL